jgi:hypothetical protein
MNPGENYDALIRHAARAGDWQLTRLLADFLEREPSQSMIAACCAYISLCEALGIDD